MTEIIIGDYMIGDDDVIVKDYQPNMINKNEFNKNTTLVMFGDELGLTKNDIEFIKDNASLNVKIILNDKNSIKGMRSSKKFAITERTVSSGNINPLDVATMIMTEKDRDYVLSFLKMNKVNLFVPMKQLACNIDQFSELNVKNVMFVCMNMWRSSPEMIYYFIAKFFKPEPIRFMKWKYPKKEETKK